jgi:hypothetical protein
MGRTISRPASGAIMLPLAIAHVVGQELYVSQMESASNPTEMFKTI